MSIVKINELDPDIIPPISSKFQDPNYNGGAKIVVVGKPGCFAPGTEIMMHNGTIKKVEDVIIGDKLMGDDSTVRNVMDLCHNKEMMYRITPKKGDTYVVNENHILSLKCTGYNNIPKGELVDITVKDFLNKPETFQNRYKWYRKSVDFPEKDVTLDPYLLGYWLGDGTSSCAQITTADEEIINTFTDKLAEMQLFLSKSNSSPYRYQIKQENFSKSNHQFLNSLRQYDLIKNKHIPHDYKVNSRENRLQLLAGILDSDGYYDHRARGFDIVQKNERLLDDIIYVSRSLGFSAYKKECTKRCTNSIDHVGLYYRCFISGNVDTIPSQIFRKQADSCVMGKDVLSTGFTIEKLEVGEYFGFVLDGNHRFLGSDFSVLHNTGKSTLIKALLHAKKHIFPVGMAMSGSEDSNHCYSEIMPSTFVYNEYDEQKVTDFVKRQKLAAQHLANPWAVLILDDCTDDPRIFNKPLQQALYKKGRHWKMFYILSLQYAMDVKPSIRTNVDGIFILREPLLKNREALYKNYASIIPDFTTFCELMDQLTDDYCALYIHNATQTNDWFDCVFYWKAPQVPKGWKFGCPEYWEFHQARFNENYTDNLTGF
jgi:hypothetical protein